MKTKDKHQNIRLLIDLFDVDGRLIAKEGVLVNESLIREVMRKGRFLQKKTLSLNRPEILKEAVLVMNEEIYCHMFAAPETQRRILQIIRRSRIQASLLKEIFHLRKKSYFTYRHFVLMGVLTTKMALDLQGLGYKPQEAFVLALTHDIGKARLPLTTLNKKKPLTSNEYRILHSYPNFSILLLRYYLGKRGTEAVRVSYEHHEKLDGSGYPKGIKTMSKYTKIVAVIDIFDAMVSPRPYRTRNFTVRGAFDKLIGEMNQNKLPKFPIRLLLSYFRKGRHNFRTMKISARPREADADALSVNSYGKVSGK